VDLLAQALAAMLAEAWDPLLEGPLACELERMSVTELAQLLEFWLALSSDRASVFA
jgi:hypothetical protein